MVNCYWTSQFYHKLVRSCSRIYAGSGVSQYPSQWTLQEDAWSSVTETSESTPEKIVDLYINDEERIVVFDSHSIDGGLFCLVSGEETEITNVLGIKGIMITETIDVDGEEPKMNVLAYYEDGYEDGIGMGCLLYTSKGTNHISLSELVDPELVSEDTFRLVVTAFLIRRYGPEVLSAERGMLC